MALSGYGSVAYLAGALLLVSILVGPIIVLLVAVEWRFQNVTWTGVWKGSLLYWGPLLVFYALWSAPAGVLEWFFA